MAVRAAVTDAQYPKNKITLTFSSWNQIVIWLREMDILRQAMAA